MKLLRLVLINLMVLIALLLVVETGGRGLRFAQSCMAGHCSLEYFRLQSMFPTRAYIGISREDPALGYVPNDGHFDIIDPGWHGASVTIRNGLRQHGESARADHPILAVGDSFTFGDQVGDADTWPACLQSAQGRPVLNAGVFGYGAMQSVLRAELLARRYAPDTIVWSVLIGHDLSRDRMVMRTSMLRPAVATGPDGPLIVGLDEARRIAAERKNPQLEAMVDLIGYSYIGKRLYELVARRIDPDAFYYGTWDIRHPAAADTDTIAEMAVARFSAIAARERLLVLQYPQVSLASMPAAEAHEVEALKRAALQHNLRVLDLYESLRAENAHAVIYDGHHTAAGNAFVCQRIGAALGAATQ